ncbi:MAG: hypothetical protein AB7R90_21015 [Reyranellaceae bacterium]
MSAKYTPEAMRARLAEIDRDVAAIEGKARPLREARDKVRAQMAPLEEQERALIKQYRAIEAPLYDLEQERAIIARALGAKAQLKADPATLKVKGGK